MISLQGIGNIVGLTLIILIIAITLIGCLSFLYCAIADKINTGSKRK